MPRTQIKIPTLKEEEADLPIYGSEGASGADVRAHIKEEIVLPPGSSVLVPTGLRFAIPEGYEIQVRPRSGLALKSQVTVLNTPGTIDADYRGELGVILINHGKDDFIIQNRMRIAQLVICKVEKASFELRNELLMTERGDGGFGHTGFH